MRRTIVYTALFTLTLGWPGPSDAATYYLGQFAGSTPSDDAGCGTGKGSAPSPHPCKTLAYWTANRANVLGGGDVVRGTGTLSSCGSVSCSNLCVLAAPNVTYEGRKGDDTPATSAADWVIDAGANTTGNLAGPCFATVVNGQDRNFTNFTLRYVTLKNGNRSSGASAANIFSVSTGNICPGPNGSCSGLVLDHIRVTGNKSNGGMGIGFGGSWEDQPCGNQYRTTNVTIKNSEFDRNNGHGLLLQCVDGFTITNTTFHDNFDQTLCNPSAPDCGPNGISGACGDQHDGIFFGAKNGVLRDVEAYRNGQDNIDLGGVGVASCDAAAHDVLIERSLAHDPLCGTNFSYSHCAYNVTTQNSMAWGIGTGINQKSCAYKLKFYNNTFWMKGRAVQFYQNCRDCEVKNNIFHCDGEGTNNQYCVYISTTTSAPDFVWENNIISMGAPAENKYAIGDFTPSGPEACTSATECRKECNIGNYIAGTCSGSGAACCSNADCGPGKSCSGANCDPQHPGYMPGWEKQASLKILDTPAGLATFRSEGSQGAWFGSESGVTDSWGTDPNMVDSSSPSLANLHLSPNDRIAIGKGKVISSFSDDIDGNARVGAAWDIGADALNGGLAVPQLLSVDPLP